MMERVSDFIREVRILLVFVYLYGLEFSFGATAISRAFGENAYIACWFLQIVCTVCIPFFAMISLNVPEAKEYGCGTIYITASDMGVKLYESYGFKHNGNFMQYNF